MTAVTVTDHTQDVATCPAYPRTRQQTLWLLTVWTACVYPFTVNVVDPDLWGHVQYAQDWIAAGTLPRISSHTFTAVGYPWINHENVSELILAFGFRQLGNVGMLLLKFSVGIGLLFVAWRESRRESASTESFLLIGLLAAYALHPFWLFRPQLATWLGLATMVWLLDRSFAKWHYDRSVRWPFLAALGPLFLLWANAHGGFLAGLCLLMAYLVGRSAEAILTKDPRAKWRALEFASVGIVTSAVTLLNPYGIRLHQWLIQSLAEPRPEIIEWHGPSILAPVFAPFFLPVLISLLGWIASTRRRDWTQGLVLMLTLSQALLHIRHIGLFAVLALFWMPGHVGSLLEISFGNRPRKLTSTLSRPPVQFACVVFILGVWGFSAHRLSTLPVSTQRYPVQALQFMNDRDIQGRLVVSFNWAQYAIAALQPKSTVGFDGRFRTCYPQHIIDKHFDLLIGDAPGRRNRAAGGEIDPSAVLRESDPELVLLDRQFPHSLTILEQQRDVFALLYEDKVAQLWGKRSRFGDFAFVRNDDHVPDPEWPGLPNHHQ